MPAWPTPTKFEDKYEERAYQKGRLALAFRIFAKFGYDEGVAGHITLRVSAVDWMVVFCFISLMVLDVGLRREREREILECYPINHRTNITNHQDPVHPDHFWVNPFGVAWPLLKASDLILVNPEGKVVDGGPCRLLNAAGT